MRDTQEILAKANEAEKEEVELLQRAVETTRKAYDGDFSAAKKRDWDAAREGLREYLAALDEIYFGNTGDDPVLENISAVVRFLQDEGYKVKKSKVYQDKGKGLLKTLPDGRTVTEAEAIAYAVRTSLKKISKSQSADLEGIQEEKSRAEVSKLKAQEEKLRFELEREKGRYLLKKDVQAEIAMKLGAIEAGVKHLIRIKGSDYIYAVGGDPKKLMVLVELLNADLDDLWNEFVSFDELKLEIRIHGEASDGDPRLPEQQNVENRNNSMQSNG
jgi:hypothetical protein